MPARIVLSTYPSREEARKAAKEAISKKLAACVNIVEINSIYTWKGRIEDTSEFLAIYKTTDVKAAKLQNFIEKSHSYDSPEVIILNPTGISKKYMAWLIDSTK